MLKYSIVHLEVCIQMHMKHMRELPLGTVSWGQAMRSQWTKG